MFIEREVPYHLGMLHCQFNGYELDEDTAENAKKTHFIINMEKRKGLGFKDEEQIKSADVMSDAVGITIVARFSGGRNAIIKPLLRIFKNEDRRYTVRRGANTEPSVAYRARPKG